MAINLVFGFTVSGINNAAHIGGMLMGSLLAGLWYLSQKTQRTGVFQFIALLVAVSTLSIFYWYCTRLSTELTPLWTEILRQNQISF